MQRESLHHTRASRCCPSAAARPPRGIRSSNDGSLLAVQRLDGRSVQCTDRPLASEHVLEPPCSPPRGATARRRRGAAAARGGRPATRPLSLTCPRASGRTGPPFFCDARGRESSRASQTKAEHLAAAAANRAARARRTRLLGCRLPVDGRQAARHASGRAGAAQPVREAPESEDPRADAPAWSL